MEPALEILFRWMHLASVVVLLGGVWYVTFFGGEYAAKFGTWVRISVVTLIGSGVYNLLTKADLPSGYHMWFGIKMLLALHIVAVALLITTPAVEAAKRRRMMTGVSISGLAVLVISAVLRWMTTS